MRAIFEGLGRFLRVCYLLRVPLLAWLVLAGLGVIANTLGATLLKNLFDQEESFWGVCAVCFCGFLLSAIIIACINVLRYEGNDRLGDPSVHFTTERPWLVSLFGALPSFVFAGFVWYGTPHLGTWAKLTAVTLAFGLAFLAGLIAKAVQLALWDGESTQHPPPDLVLPLYPAWQNSGFFQRLENLAPLRTLNRRLQPFLRFLDRYLGPGYFYEGIEPHPPIDGLEQPPQIHLRSTHVYVSGVFLVSFVIWISFGWCKRQALGYEHIHPWIGFLAGLPAIAWVLLFLMVACLLLAGLAFFLDRYRIPLLWITLGLSFLTNLNPRSDHYFRVTRLDSSMEAMFRKPADVLQMRAASGRRRFILVSTAGGGIQAAAWTAKVLRGLDGEIRGFRDSVLLISSVSGGTVGAMSYARTFDRSNGATGFDPVDRSRMGALDAAAWGWFVPDVWRAVNPFRQNRIVDRGWAIDEKWTQIFQLRPQGRDLYLRDWAAAVNEGMPALIFNSAVVETGHPVVLSNTAFVNTQTDNDTYGIYNFHSFYENYPLGRVPRYTYDISIATATRLSASFPYVAPAARSNLLSVNDHDFHYVDGGYYDNFGITALFAWLESAQNACDDCEFLLLRITHFPDSKDTPTKGHGWAFQVYAPLQGLYDARDAGQLAGDNTQVRLEQKLQNGHLYTTGIGFAAPGADCENPPLSWQLNAGQRNCIDAGWTNANLAKPKKCIQQFLEHGTSSECEIGLAGETRRFAKKKDEPEQGQ